ncbi:MAG: hypothetical protein K0S41_4324 [Anaerocolumna sp.]|jgi:hypothetical protein|nr:hypothetical protein [Anaerocolumna sp.]
MTKYFANDVIKVANKYVGYLEKASNKNLDDFTANAGKGNYTRFAREYKKFAGIDYQGQAWCDMYVDTIFVEAFGKDKAKELLGGFSAYTPTSAKYFKSKNKWHENNPQVGDIIFFKSSHRICHTGIVVKVSNTTVYTIEGNTSAGEEVIPNGGAVCEKEYSLNNPRIAGYGRPSYDKEKDVNPYKQPTTTVKIDTKNNEDDVAWVQWELIEAGIDSVVIDGKVKKVKIDGDFGEITEEAVKVFQRKYKLDDDGKVGSITRAKFIEK